MKTSELIKKLKQLKDKYGDATIGIGGTNDKETLSTLSNRKNKDSVFLLPNFIEIGICNHNSECLVFYLKLNSQKKNEIENWQ